MYPRKIYAELTTRCNLRCQKCVKNAIGSTIEEQDMPLYVFKRLSPSLKHCSHLILNGIGEPLLHPNLLEIVSLARASMPQNALIGFQSNGILLDENLSSHLIESGVSTICLSVDSLQKSRYDCGSQGEHCFSTVVKALACLLAARKKSADSLKIGVEIVLKKDTIHELPDLIIWAAANGVDYVITTHLIQYDKNSESETLFNPNPPKAINLLKEYNEIAAAKGIDLSSYFPSYRRYAGTRTDSAVLQLFSDIQKDARNRDISLNLKSLLTQSKSKLELVESIFHKARTIAKEKDIDLFLPPLQAHNQRSCPFIEDKATFIAANGDVMPCHFLWHSYTCRVHQEDIVVQKHVFGNIPHHSLEEIWQKREYKDFREEAGQGEYSTCWSCPLAPCPSSVNSNISNANDCYGSRVPCGHCQWNLGGLRCL